MSATRTPSATPTSVRADVVNRGEVDSPKFGSGAAHAERLLLHGMAFARAGGVVMVASVLVLDWHHYRFLALTLALACVVAAESVGLVWACWPGGRVRAAWVAGDVVFLVAALAVAAALTAPADGHTWVYFMYPFTVIACVAIGVAFTRLRTVIAAAAVLAGGYVLSAIFIHRDTPFNVMPNAVTYLANATVVWAVARQLRRSGRSLDAVRVQAVAQAEDLARERERARHVRILHDHVLQTLEGLLRQRSITDHDMRSHVAAQASWLRAVITGTPIDEPGDLLSRLQKVIQHGIHAGLRIEFNNAQLLGAPAVTHAVSPQVSAAVADAVREALANVAKHAMVNAAIVWGALTHDALEVTVLDHGIGFDPEHTLRGIGIEESIIGRIREVGGSVRIDSAPGAGTYIELTIPSASRIQGMGTR